MARSKTQEEFVNDLKIKNPNYKVTGTYINAKTKVEVECRKCGLVSMKDPKHLYEGTKCRNCYANNNKTHEQFMAELDNDKIEVIGRYRSMNNPIRVKCRKCGYEWEPKATNIFHLKQGCKLCYSTQKKTIEQFQEEVFAINPNLKVLEYKSRKDKCKMVCLICGKEKNIAANDFLKHKSTKCYTCHLQNIKFDFVEFTKKLKETRPEMIIIDKFLDNEYKVKVFCTKCGNEYKQTPYNLLKAKECSRCAGFNRTHEEFLDKMSKINKNLEFLEEYKKSSLPIKTRCKICGHEWSPLATTLINTLSGCPKCSSSLGEIAIETYCKNNFFSYTTQHTFKGCKDKKILRFDFAIFSVNKLIALVEHQGKQHYEPIDYFGGEERFKDQQRKDNIKRNYCKSKGIKLIEIPYWEKDIYCFLDSRIKENIQLSLI